MRSLGITNENMRREIEVVKEERRLRVDNQPYGTSQLQAALLRSVRCGDLLRLRPLGHRIHGGSGCRAAAGRAGVLRPVLRSEQRHPDPRAARSIRPRHAVSSSSTSERFRARAKRPAVSCENPFSGLPSRQTVEDSNARLPAFWASYGGVSAGHEDSYALSLLAGIIGQGESSRLHQRLVQQEQAAVGSGMFGMFRRGPGLVIVQAVANQGVETERLEQLVDEEIDRIRREGVTRRSSRRRRTDTGPRPSWAGSR
jgi:zinc protease